MTIMEHTVIYSLCNRKIEMECLGNENIFKVQNNDLINKKIAFNYEIVFILFLC